MVKSLLLLALLLHLSSFAVAPGRYVKIEFCTSSNKSLKIERCDLTNGTLNVVVEFQKATQNIFILIKFYSKDSSNNWRQIGNFPKVDFCGLVTSAKQNPFISGFFKRIKDAAPHLIRTCPYNGRLEILNFLVDFDKNRFITRGVYKFELYCSNNEDANIFSESLVFIKT